ncbi:MAG TPA: YesL family protein [Candidatus Blautia merdipullorum]|nr:YesL family protein [Candidatus Blautia merdipullorum]
MGKKKTQRNIFGFDGSFTNICDKIFDVMALGFLWILCSIPIVTIGASTSALYYAMVKCVKNGNGYIAREFFRSFRLNLISGCFIWILVVAATFAMHLNIGILMKETDGYVGLFFICVYALTSVWILAFACYVFPALARFDMSSGWLIKLAMYMTVRYFGTTLALLLVLACTGAIIWRFPILVIFAPGPVIFLMSEFLERVLKKHEPDRQETGEYDAERIQEQEK